MRIFLIIIFTLFQNSVYASIKSKIINNFKLTNSLKFDFVQKINEKVEKGNCVIAYPKKIFCKYDDFYNKILVSNGKSLVINSDRNNQYYRYRLDKTPLNLILDKNFLIENMKNFKDKSNLKNEYSFKFYNDKTSIIIYFDKNTLNLIGWKTIDIYQNQVETKLSNVETNVNLNFKLFDIQNYIN